jgi:hypothetical protein
MNTVLAWMVCTEPSQPMARDGLGFATSAFACQLQPQVPQPLPQQAVPSALASVSQGQHSGPAAASAELAEVAEPVPHELPVPHDEPLSQQLLALALAFATAAWAAAIAAGEGGAQPQPAGCSTARVSQHGLPSAFGWLFSQQGVAAVGSQQGDSRRRPDVAVAVSVVPQLEPGPQPPAPQLEEALESVPQLEPVPQPPAPQDDAPRARDGTSTTVKASA